MTGVRPNGGKLVGATAVLVVPAMGCLFVAPAERWTAIIIAGLLGLALWLLKAAYQPLLSASGTNARQTRRSRLADEPVGRYLLWSPFLAPVLLGLLVPDRVQVGVLALVWFGSTVAWLEYLARSRGISVSGQLPWSDETLEAYRPSLLAGVLVAAGTVAAEIAVSLSDNQLSPGSVGWSVGVGAAGIVVATYGRFFLTWLEDPSTGLGAKVIASTSWLLLATPLAVAKATEKGIAIAVSGVAAACAAVVVLEYLRRDGQHRRMRLLDSQGFGPQIDARYR